MTVDTDALVAWLREQLDQEARLATEASGEDGENAVWTAEDEDGYLRMGDFGWYVAGAGVETSDSEEGKAIARHIARWDPARVLAEVEAKRARIDLLAETAAKCPPDDWPDEGGMEWAPLADYARHLLRLEAQPLAGRPGFKPEWRVT